MTALLHAVPRWLGGLVLAAVTWCAIVALLATALVVGGLLELRRLYEGWRA